MLACKAKSNVMKEERSSNLHINADRVMNNELGVAIGKYTEGTATSYAYVYNDVVHLLSYVHDEATRESRWRCYWRLTSQSCPHVFSFYR